MNGESVFGWLKVAAVLIVLAIVAVVAFLGWQAVQKFLGKAGEFFKPGGDFSRNPVKTTADDVVTRITGREESLGGWLAELLDPTTRAANAELRRIKPTNNYEYQY